MADYNPNRGIHDADHFKSLAVKLAKKSVVNFREELNSVDAE